MSDLQQKDVVDIKNGKCLGRIYDIEVNLKEGNIQSILVSKKRNLLLDWVYIIIPRKYLYFGWKDIKQIGEDIILLDSHK